MKIHMISEVPLKQGLVCESDAMMTFLHELERAAHATLPVCIQGAPGAPLALVARHLAGDEALSIYAGAYSGDELFAMLWDEHGKWRSLTIILHEVTRVPERVLWRLGAMLEEHTHDNVRLICTTRESIDSLDDHLARLLCAITLKLPTLSTRSADILPLAMRFITQLNEDPRSVRHITALTEGVRIALLAYAWPGDELELRNLIAQAFLVGDGNVWGEDELPDSYVRREGRIEVVERSFQPPQPLPLSEELSELTSALVSSGGNRTQAAKMLGISRTTLWRKLREHDLL